MKPDDEDEDEDENEDGDAEVEVDNVDDNNECASVPVFMANTYRDIWQSVSLRYAARGFELWQHVSLRREKA